LPSHKIRITKDFAKKLPLIKGDSHQLQEVFINLFINACQAMPEGGRLIIKTVNSGGEFVRISISDTGHGIDPKNLNNLFMPFFSTKSEGTGLGLSICYNIIKNHHGFIEVESQVGKGTTFIIKFPFIKKGE
jgi:two-component system NtrC family sensor kinase